MSNTNMTTIKELSEKIAYIIDEECSTKDKSLGYFQREISRKIVKYKKRNYTHKTCVRKARAEVIEQFINKEMLRQSGDKPKLETCCSAAETPMGN